MSNVRARESGKSKTDIRVLRVGRILGIAMKTILLLISVFWMAPATFAQTAKILVFWSGDRECGIKVGPAAAGGVFLCSSTQTGRGPVSTITHKGVSLSVAFIDDGDFHIVAARLANNSQRVIQFDSDEWGAAHYRSKNDFDTGQSPQAAETSVPSRDLIKSISAEMKIKDSIGDFMGDIQMTGKIKELRREDGTRYKTTVIVPDDDARRAEARQLELRKEIFTREQQEIRKYALTAKSVPGLRSVTGRVYFRTVADTDFVVFSLSVAGISYVFQLPKASDKP